MEIKQWIDIMHKFRFCFHCNHSIFSFLRWHTNDQNARIYLHCLVDHWTNWCKMQLDQLRSRQTFLRGTNQSIRSRNDFLPLDLLSWEIFQWLSVMKGYLFNAESYFFLTLLICTFIDRGAYFYKHYFFQQKSLC